MGEDEDCRSTGRDVSREYADELGRQEKDKGTKDGFGDDLNDSGARFFGLRDSGYKGWIDQDGYMA